MTEPTITWPSCKTENRLTESLDALLIAATRTRLAIMSVLTYTQTDEQAA